MKRLIYFLALMPCLAFGINITTRDGSIYKGAEIMKVEVDGLRIGFPDGIVKIPFENLPTDLQQEFHYDPVKAAAYRKSIADAKREVAQRLEAAQKAATEKALKIQREREEADSIAVQLAKDERQKQIKADTQREVEKIRQEEWAGFKDAAPLVILIAGWVIVWSVFWGGIGAMIGRRVRAQARTGFWLGFFLGWIGWLLIFVIEDRREKCPECYMVINPFAKICPHCRTTLRS